MCALRDTLTARMKLFCTKKGGWSKNFVKAHTKTIAVFKAFGFANGINFAMTTIKDGGGEPTDNLKAGLNALKATTDAAERSMSSFLLQHTLPSS